MKQIDIGITIKIAEIDGELSLVQADFVNRDGAGNDPDPDPTNKAPGVLDAGGSGDDTEPEDPGDLDGFLGELDGKEEA